MIHGTAVHRDKGAAVAWFLAVTMLAAVPLPAQRVHGTLRDTASAQPVLGAVLTLLDSAGRVLARTISDEHGQYSLPTGVGRRRVRAMRIGFQPLEVAVAREDDVTLDIAMTRIPALLSSVKVSGRPLCPGSGDQGLAFSLWEQARAALLASVVAREAKPAAVRTLRYDRTLNPNDDRVRTQTQSRLEGKSSRPFLAFAEPSVFARAGYMKEDRGGRTYYAPDADVLLDESFAVTHCFTLTIDREHPAQVGIAFTPAGGRGRDTLVDVNGVLWLDRDHPELRSLEFEYTGLEPVASTVNTGGILSFRTMSNGIVMIDWWSLRLPVLVPTATSNAPMSPYGAPASDLRSDRRNLRVHEVRQSGGELLSASWRDGTALTVEPARIVGHVLDKATSKPRAGVVVRLDGTYEETKTDSSGAFLFTSVIPGKYTLTASDTLLSDIAGAREASRNVEVTRGDTVAVDLTVSPLRETVSRVCSGTPMPAGTAILIGTLLDSAGAPLRAVTVNARWLADVSALGDQAIARNSERTYQPDERGRFFMCGVARERPIRIRVAHADGSAVVDTTAFAYDEIARWTLRVRSRKPAAPTQAPPLTTFVGPVTADVSAGCAAGAASIAHVSRVDARGRRYQRPAVGHPDDAHTIQSHERQRLRRPVALDARTLGGVTGDICRSRRGPLRSRRSLRWAVWRQR